MKSSDRFGVNMNGNMLLYYPNNLNIAALSVTRQALLPINIEVSEWSKTTHSWKLNSVGNYKFILAGLKSNSSYNLIVNGKRKQSYTANEAGIVSFEYRCNIPIYFSLDD